MFDNINIQRIKMYSPISKLALAVGIHCLKNKTLINKLETFWINEELAAHGRYSPLSIFVLFLLVDGLILCACSHWIIQFTGIAVCLLATSMIVNIGGTLWRSYKAGVLQSMEAA